jgi:two-component system, OmpR family, sensor kinase
MFLRVKAGLHARLVQKNHSGTSFAGTAAISNSRTPPDQVRLLDTLQELFALPALDLTEALMAAAQSIVKVMGCDKVDAFVLDQRKQTLRAIGTSDTPMGRLQRALGLDALALANGGRVVEVFKSGVSFIEGHAERDPNELRGIVAELGVRSTVAAAFDVEGVRRGVLSAVSAQPDFFQASDLQFLEVVAHWLSALIHRAELAERARKSESDQVRRAAADEIIAVLAHDLRNHLQPLLYRLQLFRLRLSEGKPAKIEEMDKAVRSVQRLSQLTTDLLDLKRLDQGLFSLELVPVDLAAIAQETAATLATSEVPVRATGRDKLVVVADADRVRQALENLVANAVKYSPPRKAVEIQVRAGDGKDKGYALLEVIDEGRGIAPEMLPKLFDRFSSSSDSPGLGLGLYLAHRIARAHEGDLIAESTPGSPTRFRLKLPFSTSPESERPSDLA